MSKLPEYRFIIARLCDSDFSYRIKDALRSLVDNGVFEFCPVIAKKYIIEHVMLSEILKGRDWANSYTRKYLEDGLRIEFSVAFPTSDLYGEKKVDHAGGSAYYDVASDEVFTF